MLALTKNELSAVRCNLDKLVEDKIVEKQNAIDNQLSILQIEKQELETRSAYMEEKHTELVEQNKELQQQVEGMMYMKDQVEKATADNDGLSTKVSELETELRISVLESARIDKQRDEISMIYSEQNEQLEELPTLREELTTSKELNISLQQTVTCNVRSLEDYKNHQKVLEEKLDGLEWKLQEGAELESELELTQHRLFEVQSENGAFKRALKEKEELLSTHDEKQTGLIAEKNDLMKQLEDATSQVRIIC